MHVAIKMLTVKIRRILFVILGILQFAGCQEWRKDNVVINLSKDNRPLSYTCSRIIRGYSSIRRFFDVTGVGYTLQEKTYYFNGEGKLNIPYNEEGVLEVWVYVHPRFYPLNLEISWTGESSKKFRGIINLAQGDYPVEMFSYQEQNENYAYVYRVCLHSDGKIKITKNQNFTLQGVKNSNAMKFSID